jgi:hypothetical protein
LSSTQELAASRFGGFRDVEGPRTFLRAAVMYGSGAQ